jgi:hypothetical protein
LIAIVDGVLICDCDCAGMLKGRIQCSTRGHPAFGHSLVALTPCALRLFITKAPCHLLSPRRVFQHKPWRRIQLCFAVFRHDQVSSVAAGYGQSYKRRQLSGGEKTLRYQVPWHALVAERPSAHGAPARVRPSRACCEMSSSEAHRFRATSTTVASGRATGLGSLPSSNAPTWAAWFDALTRPSAAHARVSALAQLCIQGTRSSAECTADSSAR